MRYAILSLAVAVVAGGCGTPDPCAGKSGTCIAAHVDGNAHDLTAARVTLPDGRVTMTQVATGTIKLPAQFAVLIGDNVPASPFLLQLDGIRGGAVVASDAQNVTIAGTRGAVKFTLNEGGGGAGGDGGGGGDMAVMNPPVVTGLDPVTVDELQPLSVDLSATDPLGGNVALSASNLPGNAMFTPSGATGKLTWTPTYTDAGSYTVKITATPDDASRTATFDLVVTVKNAADPIVIGGNPVMNAVPLGDWDKDGFGDLVVCTGDAAGATGKYHLQILYGAATGLPLDAASGAGRVDSFDMPATSLGGINYSCKGGDFDGDGHADVIFADPANDYWNATMPGSTPNEGKFTVFFGGARGTMPPSNTMVGPQNFGQHMGDAYDVGDFNGDGKVDIGTVWAVQADTAILISGGPRVNQVVPGQGNTGDYPDQGSPCAPPESIAMVDLNKDGLAEWIAQVPNAQGSTTAGGCDPTHMALGGIRVVAGRSTAPMLDPSNVSSFTDYYSPTSAGSNAYRWGREAAGCDVDNDGYGDIGLLHVWPAMTMQHGEVYYGSAAGLVATAKMALPDTAQNSFDVAAMDPAAIGCFPSYKNGTAALAVSSTSSINGPGEIELYAGRPLTKVGSMLPPSPSETRFGKAILRGIKFDVDGDGKQDVVVTSDQSGWVIYGR